MGMRNHVFIIMGVSGSGKSTLGEALAEKTGALFYDADDFHPESNKQKMQSGQPLNDNDRLPWLSVLRESIETWLEIGGLNVLACSALKADYRHILDPQQDKRITFVYLKADKDLLIQRLGQRAGHFFNPALLESQLATLEEPENALVVNAAETLPQLVDQIVKHCLQTQPV